MVKNTTIKKVRNSKGYWRLVVSYYPLGVSYYVNNFTLNGTLNSFRFKTFQEADQFFISQTKKGRSNGKSFIVSV